jgi:hypothetical protein
VYNSFTPTPETESVVFSIHWRDRRSLLILCAKLSQRASAQVLSGFFAASDLRNAAFRRPPRRVFPAFVGMTSEHALSFSRR